MLQGAENLPRLDHLRSIDLAEGRRWLTDTGCSWAVDSAIRVTSHFKAPRQMNVAEWRLLYYHM